MMQIGDMDSDLQSVDRLHKRKLAGPITYWWETDWADEEYVVCVYVDELHGRFLAGFGRCSRCCYR